MRLDRRGNSKQRGNDTRGVISNIGPEPSVVGRIIAPWERTLHLPGILVDAPALGCVDDMRVIRR